MSRTVRHSMIAALLAVVLGGLGCAARPAPAAEKGPAMQVKTRGRTGTKQGPLLMGDDFARELRAKTRGATVAKTCPLAERLGKLRAPAKGEWTFPKVPLGPAGAQATTPPFQGGCRTVGIGTGRVKARAHRGRRGTFDVLCAAGSGQYSYTVSSPCVTYRAKSDGWVSIEFVVLLSGRIEVDTGKDGKAGVEIGLYAAHCWPKQQGKYWQTSVLAYQTDTGSSIKSVPFSHRVVFPVKKGVNYTFGAGLTTQAWAKGGGSAGCRLWGRLAHVVIRSVTAPPGNLPYTRGK